MSKFTLTHEIRCDVDTFWKLFFDKGFNEKLYLGGLGFPDYAIVDQQETEARITRKVSAQPKMNVPGPVAKLFGTSFRYVEEGAFDKATQRWTWKMIPSTLADKLRHEGTLRVEPSGEGRVRRVAEILFEAKVFGVGGLIESSSEKQLRDGWEASAGFMNEFIEAAKR